MNAVVFDYEGTLGVNSIIWEKIFSDLDLNSEKSRELYLKFKDKSNDYGYSDFNEDRLQMLNNSEKLKEKDAEVMLNSICDEHFSENGLKEMSRPFIEFFNETGFDTYLISHAPDRYSQRAHEELGTDLHVDTESIVADGVFEDIQRTDNYDKAEVVDALKQGYQEVWFIGNGKNDFEAAEQADMGLIIDNLEDVDYSETEAPKMDYNQVLREAPEQLRRRLA